MRYSMKWILAAMVYVSLAAAALSQPSWVYADLLWLATFVAIIYAGLLIYAARESHRLRAIGFVLGALGYLAVLHFDPGPSPTFRLLFILRPVLNVGDLPRVPNVPPVVRNLNAERRAAHAVATMGLGLVGCLLGSLAYNRARRDAVQ